MKISTVLYVPSPYPGRGKMLFPQHLRRSSYGVQTQPPTNHRFVFPRLHNEFDSVIRSSRAALNFSHCRLPSFSFSLVAEVKLSQIPSDWTILTFKHQHLAPRGGVYYLHQHCRLGVGRCHISTVVELSNLSVIQSNHLYTT